MKLLLLCIHFEIHIKSQHMQVARASPSKLCSSNKNFELYTLRKGIQTNSLLAFYYFAFQHSH